MRVLNLYAGLGGNRKLWDNVEVTAVELDNRIASVYASQFPDDKLVIGDAHKYLLDHADEFDFIWASPPCQTHSKMMKATRHPKKRFTSMKLWQEILFLQHFYKGYFVVENVVPYYAPFIRPTRILGRHCFWTNFQLQPAPYSNHENFIKADSPEEIQSLKDWLGIQYDGNIYYGKSHSPGQVLRNCVHPELGLHVLNCMRDAKYHYNAVPLPLFT